jgi:hypothetical protein
MADDRAAKVTEVLHRAAETHHVVYAIVDGNDDDWASWYSEWLLTLSDLPEILGVRPVRSELTYALVQLDRDHRAQAPTEPWEVYYARGLMDRFGSA